MTQQTLSGKIHHYMLHVCGTQKVETVKSCIRIIQAMLIFFPVKKGPSMKMQQWPHGLDAYPGNIYLQFRKMVLHFFQPWLSEGFYSSSSLSVMCAAVWPHQILCVLLLLLAGLFSSSSSSFPSQCEKDLCVIGFVVVMFFWLCIFLVAVTYMHQVWLFTFW